MQGEKIPQQVQREPVQRNHIKREQVQREQVQRETWITGIGLVSSLGEGADDHWAALEAGKVNIDRTIVAPHVIHPLAPTNFDKQIPRKGDQRQMELWQR